MRKQMLARVYGCERKSAAERPRRKHVEAKGPSRGLRKLGATRPIPRQNGRVPMNTSHTKTVLANKASPGKHKKPGFRTKTVAMRLTPDELTEVESAAEQAVKPLSEWLRETGLRPTRKRPTDPLELALAELWALRHVLLNLFYAAAKATAEGAVMSPESVLKIGDRTAVTPDLPLTSFNFPARFNFTQFESVCSTTPRLRAASAMPWPDSTSRTASSLNSSVYRPRFPFLIHVPFPLLTQFAKGYVLRGQGQTMLFGCPLTSVTRPECASLNRRGSLVG
jgi:hypothetical protein